MEQIFSQPIAKKTVFLKRNSSGTFLAKNGQVRRSHRTTEVAIVAHYNANSFPGEVKLRRGVLKTMSEELGINAKTISRVDLQYNKK